MKRFASIIIALILLLLVGLPVVTEGIGQTPPQARVSITSTLESVRLGPVTSIYQYLLWNRGITALPIGHATTTCQNGHDNVKLCTSVFTLPHGRLVTIGETHTLRRLFSTVVGGSRSARAVREGKPGYAGMMGSMNQIRIGPGTYSLSFLLQL